MGELGSGNRMEAQVWMARLDAGVDGDPTPLDDGLGRYLSRIPSSRADVEAMLRPDFEAKVSVHTDVL